MNSIPRHKTKQEYWSAIKEKTTGWKSKKKKEEPPRKAILYGSVPVYIHQQRKGCHVQSQTAPVARNVGGNKPERID
jgi:hypothetical protein